MILLVAFQSWRAHSGYFVTQEWVLSDQSLAFASRDGNGVLPWTTYTRFKETRWSFILWNPVGSAWIMFPKRALNSDDEVRLCQALLSRQLQQSRWFCG